MAHRDEVFVAGGQPTITYVERAADHVERTFARAIATPNQIVSLSGPTKTGKTVLCKKSLGDRQFVWIDGGTVADAEQFWLKVAYELNLPLEVENEGGGDWTISGEAGVPLLTSAGGSKLFVKREKELRRVDSMAESLRVMIEEKIILVIDDFHYLEAALRTTLMRNLKGSVFSGLKVLLLSVTHRVFDAIKAESELTGRFTAISLPHWSADDLERIPAIGFDALDVKCPPSVRAALCEESQESPFLMQKFCWEICFDLGIENDKFIGTHSIPDDYDLDSMFRRLSMDAGLPIYQKLAAGPQSRKVRAKRPLKAGGEADIYQVVLIALAATGPKPVIEYEELRAEMALLLADQMPQKHEITSALKHLARISQQSGMGATVDWDENNRRVNIVDPYLRFYLRWQVRQFEAEEEPRLPI